MSQTAFAELFNLKRAAIGAYEEERAEPKVEIFVKIARYFNVPVEDLICKNLQNEGIAPSPETHSRGIDFISSTMLTAYIEYEKGSAKAPDFPKIDIPAIKADGLKAFEYCGNIIIVKKMEQTLGFGQGQKKILGLRDSGIVLLSETLDTSFICLYEIMYIIKKYDSQDFTEMMLSSIARRLDATGGRL